MHWAREESGNKCLSTEKEKLVEQSYNTRKHTKQTNPLYKLKIHKQRKRL